MLQLGLGNTSSESVPRQVTALQAHNVVLAACSYHHSMALTAEGALFAFGRNDFAQLGLGDTADRRLPTNVLNAPAGIVGMSCGQFHSVLVTASGDAFSAGKNEYVCIACCSAPSIDLLLM